MDVRTKRKLTHLRHAVGIAIAVLALVAILAMKLSYGLANEWT
jgi:hypothetical protein